MVVNGKFSILTFDGVKSSESFRLLPPTALVPEAVPPSLLDVNPFVPNTLSAGVLNKGLFPYTSTHSSEFDIG